MTHVLHRHLRAHAARRRRPAAACSLDRRRRQASTSTPRGGAAVSCLGHGHPDVLAAMHAQIDRLAYAHTSFFTTEVAEALADQLVAHARRAGIEPRLLRERRLGGDRGGAQDGAPVFRRDRRAAAQRTSSRGGRAITATRWARSPSAATRGGGAQFAPLLIDVDARRALLRVPRPARRRDAPRPTARASPPSSKRRSSRLRRRPRDRLRRRDRRRRDRRRAAAGARLLQGACARSATATASC